MSTRRKTSGKTKDDISTKRWQCQRGGVSGLLAGIISYGRLVAEKTSICVEMRGDGLLKQLVHWDKVNFSSTLNGMGRNCVPALNPLASLSLVRNALRRRHSHLTASVISAFSSLWFFFFCRFRQKVWPATVYAFLSGRGKEKPEHYRAIMRIGLARLLVFLPLGSKWNGCWAAALRSTIKFLCWDRGEGTGRRE